MNDVMRVVVGSRHGVEWLCIQCRLLQGVKYPDSNVHGANIGAIGGRQDTGGPHVGP